MLRSRQFQERGHEIGHVHDRRLDGTRVFDTGTRDDHGRVNATL